MNSNSEALAVNQAFDCICYHLECLTSGSALRYDTKHGDLDRPKPP